MLLKCILLLNLKIFLCVVELLLQLEEVFLVLLLVVVVQLVASALVALFFVYNSLFLVAALALEPLLQLEHLLAVTSFTLLHFLLMLRLNRFHLHLLSQLPLSLPLHLQFLSSSQLSLLSHYSLLPRFNLQIELFPRLLHHHLQPLILRLRLLQLTLRR